MTDDRHVIVIGSGPSGAIAALTLLREGIPVTMLESGRSIPRGLLIRLMGRNIYRIRPKLEQGQRHVASGNPDIDLFEALAPGGLSNYWTGAVPRFAPEDFEEGARLHERYRWPLSYNDLSPYYAQVEALLGVVGDPRDVPQLPASLVAQTHLLPKLWQDISRHAEACGRGLTTLPLANVQQSMVTRSGAAFNSFSRIVPMLRRYPQFRLLLGAHALRLDWCGKKKKVNSVTFFDRVTRSEQRLRCAAVVVAGGVSSSTKLLFDSFCPDFPDGLGNTEGLLGRYLHDHPKDWFVIELETALPRLGTAAYLTRAPYQECEPLIANSCTIGNRSTMDKILSFSPLKAKAFGVQIFGTMVPIESNCIMPHPQLKDEFGLPKIDIRIRYDDGVVKTMASGKDRLLAILESAGYRAAIRGSSSQLRPGSSVHYGGTVRMHASPRHGMLDAWNRLHAVENVAVADASSFTTGVEKNPALTAMALAARACHRLSADLKSQ